MPFSRHECALARRDMLRNVIGFIRPRSPSRSSSRSPSPVPNGHSDDEPWGDDDPRLRIHKAKPRAWTLLDFEWHSLAHESDIEALMQRIGVDIQTLVLRRKRVNASGTESFDYKCREHHTCGCRYALTVHFDPNGFGTIKSIEREHNEHRPRYHARVSMTREQKTFLLNAAELGVAPFRITEQMRGRNILGDLTLKQVQKFKTNHAKKILGVDGFNGTTAEYEALLTECSIERVDRDRAGVLDYAVTTNTFPVEVQAVFSSHDLMRRFATSVGFGVSTLAIDGTYKLNKESHVILVWGSHNFHQQFALGGFAIVPPESTEHYEWTFNAIFEYASQFTPIELNRLHPDHGKEVWLMGDGATAISAGARNSCEAHNKTYHRGVCWFHVTKALKENVSKLNIRENWSQIKSDVSRLHEIPFPCSEFKRRCERLFVNKWESRHESCYAEYFNDTWAGTGYAFCDSLPGLVTSNNCVENFNRQVKDEFGRKIPHLKGAITHLAKIIERETIDRMPTWETTYPEMNEADWMATDAYIRNHLNKQPARIVVDSRLTLYASGTILSETSKIAAGMCPKATDDERAAVRIQLVHESATAFAKFYRNSMLGGALEPSLDFDTAMRNSTLFYAVTRLSNAESNQTVKFSCTCTGTKNGRGYQFARKCKHVFAEGLLTKAVATLPYGFNRVDVVPTPGRGAEMRPALTRQPTMDERLSSIGLPANYRTPERCMS